MQVVLLGRTVTFRWRTLFFALATVAILSLVGLFSYYFVRSYFAIRKNGSNAWLEQRLDSSVGRAIANAHVTPEDLKALVRPGRPAVGPENAKLTVVAFLDYGCPYCRRAAGPFRETMLKHQDKVRFVVRDFPVEELHPNAFQASLAARCAFAQNKGWAFHDALFALQGDLNASDFETFAVQAGVKLETFRACVQSQAYAAQIQEDLADGLRAGVQGTPTYFFNGVRIQGVPEDRAPEYFDYLIERFSREPSTP